MKRTLTILSMSMLAAAPALADTTLAPGGTVPKAVTLDVSPNGINFGVQQGMQLIPTKLDLPATGGSQGFGICTVSYSLYDPDDDKGAGQTQLTTTGDAIHVGITSATVVPQSGKLSLMISGAVVGTGTDTEGPTGSQKTDGAGRLQYGGCSLSCDDATHYSLIEIGSTPFSVTTTLNLSLVPDANGIPRLHASTPLSKTDITLSTGNISAQGCDAASFASFFNGLFADPAKQKIVDVVNQNLIPAIDDGFNNLNFDQDVALGGATMHLSIMPSALSVTPQGVAISMSSKIDAPATTCVPIDPSAGSTLTAGDPPAFGTTSPGGNAFDAAAAISDDFANQALFSAWYSGMLCHTVDSIGGSPLTTDMLTLAGASSALKGLGIEAGTPMLVVIKAYNPPTATFGGTHLINLDAKKVELSIFTTVQDRVARIVALDLDVSGAGVDLSVDASNNLLPTVAITGDDITTTVGYDEPLGDDAAQGLVGLIPVLLTQLGPQLQSAIPQINLGNLAGVELTNPEFLGQQGVNGVPNDNLSVYTGLAAAPGGCAAGSGCGIGSAGCDVGGRRGAVAGAPMMLLALLSLGSVIARRRSRGEV